MNELLQKHGCSAVFKVPEGLKELMSDITREVLRDQPQNIFDYITNYLSVLLITREHGIMAVKILEDLCDCQASVSEHLLQLGLDRTKTEILSQIIKEEIQEFEPVEGKEKVKETQILKKILTRTTLDEDMSAKVCQVARNAYRDYWYRKKLIEKNLKAHPEEPWEIAAERTLQLYKRTKPSLTELARATQKIQAAYRGYHVRRNTLRHLKHKHKRGGPKKELPGAPLDVANSREIDLGRVIDIKVRDDDVTKLFKDEVAPKLGLPYDPMSTIMHVDGQENRKPDDRANRDQTGISFKDAIDRAMVGVKPYTTNIAEPSEATTQQVRLPSPVPAPERASPSRIGFITRPTVIAVTPAAKTPEEIPAAEVPEELPAAVEADAPQEVPEDIPEGDGHGELTASEPSSAPMTDIEDAGDPTTDEGEE